MTQDPVAAAKEALAPLWRLAPPAPNDFSKHPAFLGFKTFCQDTFPAADRGLGFSFTIHDALRAAGLPCLLTKPDVPANLDEGARMIVESFQLQIVRHRYLCPLDLADTLPAIAFGRASVRRYKAKELGALFGEVRLARFFPRQPLDLTRLAEFQWLVVEEEVPAPLRAGQRALPFLYESMSRDFGAIDPHAGQHPGPVTDAMFGLLLAPWEDWHSLESDWRAFLIPWIHLASDDLFARPRPVPSADTLTWEPYSHEDRDGEVVEYERPVQIRLWDEAEKHLAGFDNHWWTRIEAALATPLFETPVKHFLVRAAFSDGMDQIMAHMTVIEAALGLHDDFQKKGMSPSKRVRKRLEALLGDAKAGADYSDLFKTRSTYVHGRAIPGLISSQRRNLARQLARRVAVALIDAANGPAGQGARADFLNGLA